MGELSEPKLDTACFSERRWFVGEFAFSTEKDAQAAIGLAQKHAADKIEELRREIVDFYSTMIAILRAKEAGL